MKKLKKILLINWLYFSKQLIEVDNINFLTGKNGSGKSTIVDALQIVLLGELNSRNFNKAANDKSERTLQKYLRADMDENNPRSRSGKDFSSYIACEFFDDMKKESFTIGITFECRADGSEQHRFFIFDAALPENLFIVEKQALDISSLRLFFKNEYGSRAKIYDSNGAYKDDLVSKWNIHDQQVFTMLKRAVSFQPITKIDDFITKNICDLRQKPDIISMQQNIEHYKQHERLAAHQVKQLEALKEIAVSFEAKQQAVGKRKLQNFLADYAEADKLAEQLDDKEAELQSNEGSLRALAKDEQANNDELKNAEADIESLQNALLAQEGYQEQQRLLEKRDNIKQQCERELDKLNEGVNNIRTEVVNVQRLCKALMHCAESELQEAAEQAELAYGRLAACSTSIFAADASEFLMPKRSSDRLVQLVQERQPSLQNERDECVQRQRETAARLQKLQANVKDYPAEILALQSCLRHELGAEAAVDILADVLEIADGQEQWRAAVEGYLNSQKFYLLIEPQYYQQAVDVFDRVKHQYRRSCGLVDIGKLRERESSRLQAAPNSLAAKITTENALARSYVDYLLGHVICCQTAQELRKHKVALTAQGLLYQGYVVRQIPKNKMQDAFIGQKAITLRIEQSEVELAQLQEQLAALKPQLEALKKCSSHEFLFNERYVRQYLQSARDAYADVQAWRAELEQISAKLDALNLFEIDRLKAEIEECRQHRKKLHEEHDNIIEAKGKCQARIDALKDKELPELYEQTEELRSKLEKYSQEYKNETGLPAYEKEKQRLKTAEKVIKYIKNALPQTEADAQNAQRQLENLRLDYVSRFAPCSYSVHSEHNDEFAEEQQRLEQSELPLYKEKIKKARNSALEQFQNDFLAKLKEAIEQVKRQVNNLNKALKQAQFGSDKYQFVVKKNPDYAEFYDMIMDEALMEGDGGLFAQPFQNKYAALIDDLFSRLMTGDEQQLNARKQSDLQKNIDLYTDFRTYLKFDLEVTDKNGNVQSLAATLNTKSGGETQTPFYIAVFASFAQLYQVNNTSEQARNTMRLVVFDEAFNKMDSERIVESVRLLRKLGLQAIICTPPDKLPDIVPLADAAFVATKENYRMSLYHYHKEQAK